MCPISGALEARQMPLTLKGRKTIDILKATGCGAVRRRSLKVGPLG
jgi:hypothetical protein